TATFELSVKTAGSIEITPAKTDDKAAVNLDFKAGDTITFNASLKGEDPVTTVDLNTVLTVTDLGEITVADVEHPTTNEISTVLVSKNDNLNKDEITIAKPVADKGDATKFTVLVSPKEESTVYTGDAITVSFTVVANS
ncbi:hypothetical protein Zmor_009000, partial [Zophobas morio]